MKRLLILVLIGLCGMAVVKSGQTQNPPPKGPLRLEEERSVAQPISHVFILHRLQVSGKKPGEYVWFLQKFADIPPSTPIETNETAFQSLNSRAMRDYVSHLPLGTRITYWPTTDSGVGGASAPSIQDFVTFCRSRKIDFIFGIPF